MCVCSGWDNLLAVVGSKWNVFGLDLKNEPRGRATWGTGRQSSKQHASYWTPTNKTEDTAAAVVVAEGRQANRGSWRP